MNKKWLDPEGHVNDRELARYVDALIGKSTSALSENVMFHVAECSSCREMILDIFLFLKESEVPIWMGVPREPPQKNEVAFLPSRWLPALKLVSVVLVFAFLFLAYFFVFRPGSGSELSTSLNEKIALSRPPEKNGVPPMTDLNQKSPPEGYNGAKSKNGISSRARFKPYPYLEYLVGSPSRSWALQILFPVDNAVFSDHVPFAWRGLTVEPLQLKILNNRNEVLFSVDVENSGYEFRQKLPSGLYYWKLESRLDLIYVGKFFIASRPISPAE